MASPFVAADNDDDGWNEVGRGGSSKKHNKNITTHDWMPHLLRCDNSRYILPLRQDDRVALLGALRVRTLVGEIRVLGYRCSSADTFLQLHSYAHESLLALCASSKNARIAADVARHLVADDNRSVQDRLAEILEQHQVKAIVEFTDVDDDRHVRFAVESASERNVALLTIGPFSCDPQFSGPFPRRAHQYCQQLYRWSSIICVRPILPHKQEELSVLHPDNPFWSDVVQKLAKASAAAKQSGASAPTIMIAGDKDSGKSTLIRFLVNHLLSSRYRQVQVLDTDIGQSDFTIPGSIAVHTFDAPVFGPPFARLHRADCMVCVMGHH